MRYIDSEFETAVNRFFWESHSHSCESSLEREYWPTNLQLGIHKSYKKLYYTLFVGCTDNNLQTNTKKQKKRTSALKMTCTFLHNYYRGTIYLKTL